MKYKVTYGMIVAKPKTYYLNDVVEINEEFFPGNIEFANKLVEIGALKPIKEKVKEKSNSFLNISSTNEDSSISINTKGIQADLIEVIPEEKGSDEESEKKDVEKDENKKKTTKNKKKKK